MSLESLFDQVDPDFLHYLATQIQAQHRQNKPNGAEMLEMELQETVATKLRHMHGHYPLRTDPKDVRLLRSRQSASFAYNNILCRLFEWFPQVSVKELQDRLVESQETFSVSALVQVANDLAVEQDKQSGSSKSQPSSFLGSHVHLAPEDTWLLPHLSSTQLANRLIMRQKDHRTLNAGSGSLYKSRDYIEGGNRRLLNAFPQLWKYIVRSVFEESGYDYVLAYERLEAFAENNYWWNKMTSFLFPQRQQYDTDDMYEEFLMFDISILDAKLLRRQERDDHQYAVELNREIYEYYRQSITCDCCFSDVPFEEMIGCVSEGHLVCLHCVSKYIQELTYGEAALDTLSLRIKCISSTAGSCSSCYSLHELGRKLDSDLWSSFNRTVTVLNMQKSGTKFLECTRCHYAEYYVVDKYFNLFQSTKMHVQKTLRDLKLTFGDTFANLQIPLFSAIVLLLTIHPVILFMCVIMIFFGNFARQRYLRHRNRELQSMTSPNPLADIFKTNGSGNVDDSKPVDLFKCKNCRTITCTICNAATDEAHVCQVRNEEDELRVSIERAMTNAIIRTCPLCQTQLMKSDGCNKITCKCTYAMCYCCRKDIRQESYSHFCQHFRAVPGPCTKCNRCDLWKSPDEEKIIMEAAEHARQQFMLKRNRK